MTAKGKGRLSGDWWKSNDAHSIPFAIVGTKFIKQSHYKLDKVQYCVGEPLREREERSEKNDLKANMTSVRALLALQKQRRETNRAELCFTQFLLFGLITRSSLKILLLIGSHSKAINIINTRTDVFSAELELTIVRSCEKCSHDRRQQWQDSLKLVYFVVHCGVAAENVVTTRLFYKNHRKNVKFHRKASIVSWIWNLVTTNTVAEPLFELLSICCIWQAWNMRLMYTHRAMFDGKFSSCWLIVNQTSYYQIFSTAYL